MAEPFKTFINAAGVERAAAHLSRTSAAFDAEAFCAEVVPRLDALELKARAMCVAEALERHLAADFAEAASHLERSLAPLDPHTGNVIADGEASGLAGWFLWAAGEFVARRGQHDPARALECLRQLTKRFTAEFAIRPFLVQHPEDTRRTLQQWVHDPSAHVRRLVSEGTRPRLPWGLQLKALIADPSPSWPLLEALMDDSSEYVRRSVANHLNDIAKDHPDLVADWVARHLPGASDARRALLRHASRTLVKRGHARLLQTWGTGAALEGTATLRVVPPTVRLGEQVTLQVTLVSAAQASQRLTLDYVVHHVKANGRTSPKVFKGWTCELAAGATVELTRRHAVKPITTRRYYNGTHAVDLQVNGTIVASAAFTLEGA